MPFRTEGLGVDAGLMSFIQDTKRKTFRGDSWHVATKVPVKVGDQYKVSVDVSEDGGTVSKLKICRVRHDGNLVIESGCEHLIISDPCYILPDKTWGEFCDSLHAKEQHGAREYPIFIDHNGAKVAVSGSGYGDGYYSCNIETDDDGNLKEASIDFLGDEEEEE
jgi:hypothetical protein